MYINRVYFSNKGHDHLDLVGCNLFPNQRLGREKNQDVQTKQLFFIRAILVPFVE
jgi:hypothetical protein